jgi:hypothetical protein
VASHGVERVGKTMKTPRQGQPGRSSVAVDSGLGDGPDQADDLAGAISAEAELALADLMGDDNGEVVFFNDSDLRRLAITTDATVVADGRASRHRTAAGEDVSGFDFLTFDNGVTLYYRAGLDVVVRAGSG